GLVPASSMSAVASSFLQNVDAGAIGTDDLMVLDEQKHPGMAERTAVAGDGAVVDVKGLRGQSGAVRHVDPRSGGVRARVVAGPGGRSMVLSFLLLLGGCFARFDPPGPAIMRREATADAFVMRDGMPLPYRDWLPDGPTRAVVLALHGMNDS